MLGYTRENLTQSSVVVLTPSGTEMKMFLQYSDISIFKNLYLIFKGMLIYVLPLETSARKTPTKGAQDIHHPQ